MLKGKNAIITGARRGIGRATVETFASQGANVWACTRKQDDAFEADMKSVAEKHGVEIWPVYFDVTNESEMKSAVQNIRKQKISIDALVNIAGIADDSTSFQMTSMEKMKHVLDVNFFAVTLLTQYISRLMARQNYGSIVNIASIAGIDGAPAQYEYAASKAAIIGGTRNLARELASNNIRVNAVAPGMIATDMGAQIDDELKQSVLSKVIMNRLGKPEEIADVVAFLASDMSSYMTGQIIRVDGGM
ncbi:MAG: 3-oxoacyl-ACP reductase FabG [Oribacterium sp.]|nr:3-oxoacyl-ACP reductase FabG [Lachnospiraceae bacterium]MBP3805431.1 3-oxoacyl-ACP reductase FabG [Oribacterium sp.]